MTPPEENVHPIQIWTSGGSMDGPWVTFGVDLENTKLFTIRRAIGCSKSKFEKALHALRHAVRNYPSFVLSLQRAPNPFEKDFSLERYKDWYLRDRDQALTDARESLQEYEDEDMDLNKIVRES